MQTKEESQMLLSEMQHATAMNHIFKLHERRLRKLCLVVTIGPPIGPFDGKKKQKPSEHRIYHLSSEIEIELYAEDIDSKLHQIEKLVTRLQRVMIAEDRFDDIVNRETNGSVAQW